MQPTTLILPAFGSVIPGQGGRLAAIMRGPVVNGVEQPPYALLVSASRSSEFRSCWSESEIEPPSIAWSRTDGLANTRDMLSMGYPAAVRLRDQPIDGHNDWYVPSVGEIRAAMANVPELLDPTAEYWTSTRLERDVPFLFLMSQNRAVGRMERYFKYPIRPCRRIPLDLLTPKTGSGVAGAIESVPFTLPALGSLIPHQGGRLVAIMRGPTIDGVEQPPHALLISSGTDKEFRRVWGKKEELPGCGSQTDGLANTRDMLEAGCPAALCLREGLIDGHDDWYLPSTSELMAAATNVPELLRLRDQYWSSTQLGSEIAAVYASDPRQDEEFFNDKRRSACVRPFRRIPLSLLTI